MNKIKEIRELRGLSQARLADLIGTSQPQIDRLEKGQRKLTTDWMARIAAALNCKQSDLLVESAGKLATNAPISKSNVRNVVRELPDFQQLPKDVPVYGTAECGDGAFYMNEGQVVDWVRRPPGIERARGVFGIYLHGSSMEPAWHSGDLVFLDPNRPPQVGRYVVLELKPKRDGDAPIALFKVLLRRTGEYYELRQFNPEKTFKVKVGDILRAHRVLTNAELLGI